MELLPNLFSFQKFLTIKVLKSILSKIGVIVILTPNRAIKRFVQCFVVYVEVPRWLSHNSEILETMKSLKQLNHHFVDLVDSEINRYLVNACINITTNSYPLRKNRLVTPSCMTLYALW